jgi:hypothetical protein
MSRGKPGVARRQALHTRDRQIAGGARALKVSRGSLFENGIVNGQIGDDLLQPLVLALQILQLPGLIDLHIEATGVAPNAFVFMSPPNQGAQSIGGAEDACAMAQAVRERLGEILKVRQLRMTRLFFYGPFALSVFLGQQLTSIGQVQLFEYQDPGYIPSCLLRT